MFNSLTGINSTVECEELIRMAERDKRSAEVKMTNLSYRSDSSVATNQDRAFDLQDAQGQLTNTQNQMTGLTPGTTDWKKLEAKRKDIDAKIYRLQLNQEISLGIQNAEREYELQLLDVLIAKVNEFIAAVNTRKAELSA